MMKEQLKAVFFDVDGVLLDSLPQHLQICRDKAKEFGLDLKIPTVEAFRQLVNLGIKVSPMVNFFLAVGFPIALAQRAVKDYDREFGHRYRPPVFSGVQRMLEDLRYAGLNIGLVTSNTLANIEPALGEAMRYFERSCVFCYDDLAKATLEKSFALKAGAHQLNANAAACMYIGDLPADATAAQDAGFQFLGVTYGWGITDNNVGFDTVGSIAEIRDRILESVCVQV
jgi:phosphoglycolate phosphatase